MKIRIGVLLSVTGTSLLFSCGPKAAQEQAQTEIEQGFCINDQLKQSTEIIDVTEQPISEQLTLSGKIEYNENDMVAFRTLLDGVVESVQFELGDYVRKGQVLATIKSAQIQELHQQKRYQENQIGLLEKQINSKKEMAADGLVAAPEVLAAEHELESARIELDRVNESLQLYRAVGGGAFQILAPKNGYIIQKSVSVGQTITPDSDPLFSVSNLKEVWVMVNIYASNLRFIKVGDEVKVRTIAYPDQFYQGKIDKIYNVFDDNEHVLKARVVLSNQHLNLMPGLSADIIINMKNDSGSAFAIPNRAKVFSNNKEYIVVYKDDCNLDVRRIKPVAANEEYTFIAERLAEGERVIGSNALLIFEQLSQPR
ncbi:cobalt-zinc-cadmium efflux system membrane fusion protein [Sphingobacterium allocomposti]|uniref:Cobalt-zinc-cadmium efflux system membrane fusion protein n=1 Tax=Sphingobacterium allocomposti TaxID=415956 RepID=A0A5S5DFW1_9SPHI|nr:efflux RND transporter periplasmic adaptor subunit [Sphingobacterium composti Yoo et al. 2007 non Ten et al. 2007]TYP94228.1 cobalt-zinc-cadmium efflux system membrane fusion protein [Sphingobacterium composti Yoo et al. 2007 non Ten et al. 2007]